MFSVIESIGSVRLLYLKMVKIEVSNMNFQKIRKTLPLKKNSKNHYQIVSPLMENDQGEVENEYPAPPK